MLKKFLPLMLFLTITTHSTVQPINSNYVFSDKELVAAKNMIDSLLNNGYSAEEIVTILTQAPSYEDTIHVAAPSKISKNAIICFAIGTGVGIAATALICSGLYTYAYVEEKKAQVIKTKNTEEARQKKAIEEAERKKREAEAQNQSQDGKNKNPDQKFEEQQVSGVAPQEKDYNQKLEQDNQDLEELKRKEEAERKQREEAERKQREEAERKQREEAERKQREEAERRAKEEEKKRLADEKAKKSAEIKQKKIVQKLKNEESAISTKLANERKKKVSGQAQQKKTQNIRQWEQDLIAKKKEREEAENTLATMS